MRLDGMGWSFNSKSSMLDQSSPCPGDKNIKMICQAEGTKGDSLGKFKHYNHRDTYEPVPVELYNPGARSCTGYEEQQEASTVHQSYTVCHLYCRVKTSFA